MPRALVVSPEGLRVAAHPDPAVTAEMLRAARDHGAGDQAARDHDVARAALDDSARDDAALDHDLRAGRDAGHHLLGALHTTRVFGQHRPSVLRLLSAAKEGLSHILHTAKRGQRAIQARSAQIYCANLVGIIALVPITGEGLHPMIHIFLR